MSDQDLAVPPTEIRRIAFLGSPQAAVPSLLALVEAGFELPVVITQPDRRRGRGAKKVPTAVKAAALDHGIAVAEDPDVLMDCEIDLAVVVAFGRIISRSLLEQVPMVNVHFSLLPRWRGAAPVERAILAGDQTTGVCIMRVAEGLDEGPLYSCEETAIGSEETANELTERLARIGAELLVATLQHPLPPPVSQTGSVTYADKLDRSENQLDFASPAAELHRQVRVGRAWTTFRSSRLVVDSASPVDGPAIPAGPSRTPGALTLSDDDTSRPPAVLAGTGDGTLELLVVKPEGRRAMTALDWWNGAQPTSDERLGR